MTQHYDIPRIKDIDMAIAAVIPKKMTSSPDMDITSETVFNKELLFLC